MMNNISTSGGLTDSNSLDPLMTLFNETIWQPVHIY